MIEKNLADKSQVNEQVIRSRKLPAGSFLFLYAMKDEAIMNDRNELGLTTVSYIG